MTVRELSARVVGLCFLIKQLHHGCVVCGRSLFAIMTLKIDKITTKRTTVIRLIGRLRRERLAIVSKQIQSSAGEIMSDLTELGLINVEARFSNACQEQGIVVANTSPCVTDWMKRERMPTDDDPC